LKTAYSIQFLRAIAALSVLLYHEGLLENGYAGVDVFFVISGVIMGMTGLHDRPAPFLIKRAIRIIPLYWAATLVTCALAASTNLFRRFTFDTPSLLKSLFFIPYFNPEGKVWPLIVPGWTLEYEMFFYLVFALGLYFKKPVVMVVSVMLACATTGFVIAADSAPLTIYTNQLLLEFAAGVLLARAPMAIGMKPGIAFVIAGVAGYMAVSLSDSSQSMPRILAFGVPAFLVVAGCIAIERAGKWHRIRPMEMIGDASYSLYLLHGQVIALIEKTPLGHSQWLKLPVVIALSIAVAILSYRFFELPMGRVLRKYLLPDAKRAPIGRPLPQS